MTHLHLNELSLICDMCLNKITYLLTLQKLSTLNRAKTEFMLIGSRQKFSSLSNPLKLSIDNVAIEHVFSIKSLGIFIDENLRW